MVFAFFKKLSYRLSFWLVLTYLLIGGLPTLRGNAANGLTSVLPNDGAQLWLAPRRIDLYFERPMRFPGTMALYNSQDERIFLAPYLDPLNPRHYFTYMYPRLPAGEYRLTWRVLTIDRQVVQGESHFRVRIDDDWVIAGTFLLLIGLIPLAYRQWQKRPAWGEN